MAWNPKFELESMPGSNDFIVTTEGRWQDNYVTQIIPKGFKTNLADISFHPQSHAAAVVHDLMYSELPCGQWAWVTNFWKRRLADKTFRRIMKHDGVPFIPRHLMMAGVRLFGWIHLLFTKECAPEEKTTRD